MQAHTASKRSANERVRSWHVHRSPCTANVSTSAVCLIRTDDGWHPKRPWSELAKTVHDHARELGSATTTISYNAAFQYHRSLIRISPRQGPAVQVAFRTCESNLESPCKVLSLKQVHRTYSRRGLILQRCRASAAQLRCSDSRARSWRDMHRLPRCQRNPAAVRDHGREPFRTSKSSIVCSKVHSA